MMYEVRRRKSKPTILLTHGIYIDMVWELAFDWLEELAFDDAVSYTQQGNGLQHS